MRVLQVHTRYRLKGGEDTAVDNERALLLGGGHQVDVHFEENPPGRVQGSVALAKAPWNGSATARVLDRAMEMRPDVIHVHNTWFTTTPAVFPLLRKRGLPVVATVHNYRLACVNAMLYRQGAPCEDCVGKVAWRGVIRRCYRNSALQSGMVAATQVVHRVRGTWEHDVQVIVALTRFAADLLVRSGVPSRLIEVKPNVVVDPGSRTIDPDASDRVLFVGRLSEEKGVADLLSAWTSRRPEGLHLDVVGDGPLRARLEATPGISLLGSVPNSEVSELMLRARALIVPSRWYEGQPMVILEALASGLPVVVPDFGALPETAGKGGLIFHGGDVEHMVEILHLLGDGPLVRETGEAARSEYELRYSEPVGLRSLEALYSLAIERA